jgi:hypothetical protein
MASTGLLGINPYRGGNVAIDFTSKPTQLAIGLIQKQRAQAEATDKYFKDWEKSINPAGLSKAEVDIFAKKLKEVQEYGIKNKQAITNPSKYGYDAQSTLMAGFKDLQGFIEQGKQATAERKAFKDYINQAIKSGKRVSDNYLDVMNNAMLPVGAGYTPPDIMQVDIYDPHDEKKFTTNVWGGIKLPTKEVFEKEIINNKPTGKFIKKTYETLDDNTVKNAMLGAINEYKTSKGTREHFDELFKDKDFTSQINENFRKKFNKDISSGSDLAIGYALTQKPGGLIKTEAAEYDWETKFNKTQARADLRSALNRAAFNTGSSPDDANLFDAIPNIGTVSGNTYIKDGKAFDKNGNAFSGKMIIKKEHLPAEIFSIIPLAKNVTNFDVTFEDGVPVKFVNKKTGVIDRRAMYNYQLKSNTEPGKGDQPIFDPKLKPKPKPGGKVSSGIDWEE